MATFSGMHGTELKKVKLMTGRAGKPSYDTQADEFTDNRSCQYFLSDGALFTPASP
jgi:hypothetical protein